MAKDPVHSLRVGTKRVRAILRLSKQKSSRRNRTKKLRILALELAPLRDNKILSEQLKLAIAASPETQSGEIPLIRKLLKYQSMQPSSKKGRLSKVSLGLKKLEADFQHESNEKISSTDLVAGLCKSYQKAKRAQKKCQNQRSFAGFHEWRKSTKILQYQLEAVLKYQRPKTRTMSALSDLTDLQGQIQDLAAFVRFLKTHRVHLGQMRRNLRQKRRKLENKALNEGGKIFKFGAKHWIKVALPKA